MHVIKRHFVFIFAAYFVFLVPFAQAHYQARCDIFDDQFVKIKEFAGEMCVFLEDGSLVQYVEDKGLSYLSPLGEVLWTKKLRLHHQMNHSLDKKEILIMGEQIEQENGADVDYAVFSVIDLKSGKVVKKFSMYDHRREFFDRYMTNPLSILRPVSFRREILTARQFVHANSFYEIPKSFSAAVPESLKKGGYIINFLAEGIFIIDHEMKNIIWHEDLKHVVAGGIHDAQLLSNGQIVFFSNEGLLGYPTQSSMHSMDLAAKNIRNLYPKELARPREFKLLGLKLRIDKKRDPFHSVCCGGVQVTSKGYLFNINSKELGGIAYLADFNGNILYRKPSPYLDYRTNKFSFFQQIKEFNLTSFLARNKL